MSTYYFAETTQGTGDGATAANAKNRTWFETAGNWSTTPGTSNKISPGDTVHIVGTIAGLNPQGNGISGNPITILWDSGAKVSTPAATCSYIVNRSWLVFDGGTNGIVECTANGTALANRNVVFGFNASGISNVTFRNLAIQNLYVHTDDAAGLADNWSTGVYISGIYANGYGTGILIEDCDFSHAQWCINMGASGGSAVTINRCTFIYYDHGFGGGGGGASTNSLTITNCDFGTTRNWDTTSNAYHHDGIHTFWAPGTGGITNAVITGNKFWGDWGINNTAHMYFEQDYTNHYTSEAPGWLIANNVHLGYAGCYMTNGFMIAQGDTAKILNNTYIGASVSLSKALGIAGTGVIFKNNLVSGVNTFIDLGNVAASGLNNNLYTYAVAPGNQPFKYNGTFYSSFSAWRTATGQDAASTNPATATYNSDGSLPSGSAGIDAGTDVSTYITTDYLGNARAQGAATDIGAYEFISSGSTPTFSVASINSAGTQLSATWSESCTVGVGGNGGMVVTASGGAVTLTYASGSPGNPWLYNTSRVILQGETISALGYTQPGNGIEATDDGTDMATFSGQSVTNNSTVALGKARQVRKAATILCGGGF